MGNARLARTARGPESGAKGGSGGGGGCITIGGRRIGGAGEPDERTNEVRTSAVAELESGPALAQATVTVIWSANVTSSDSANCKSAGLFGRMIQLVRSP